MPYVVNFSAGTKVFSILTGIVSPSRPCSMISPDGAQNGSHVIESNSRADWLLGRHSAAIPANHGRRHAIQRAPVVSRHLSRKCSIHLFLQLAREANQEKAAVPLRHYEHFTQVKVRFCTKRRVSIETQSTSREHIAREMDSGKSEK
ncbi:hypothetical protein ElyMa_004629200 [Elysia marginata]|uniref:Uncharacterized protein n=1 Tax=Elysia marginata TaxID=1093978 RepID=A0AAV4I2T8_9GAST|nr:hypothetical protein ElyMa_004629200 [Elysia marginata]